VIPPGSAFVIQSATFLGRLREEIDNWHKRPRPLELAPAQKTIVLKCRQMGQYSALKEYMEFFYGQGQI